MLKADLVLFPSGYPPSAGDNLVVDVLDQEPPIEQSQLEAVLPKIFVSYSRNPMPRMEYTGRDTRDESGAKTYFLEFYNVVVTREITRQVAAEKAQQIATAIRNVYQKNLRMKAPTDPSDFIAVTTEVTSIPYILRSSNPALQAINVICRPQQKVSFTE